MTLSMIDILSMEEFFIIFVLAKSRNLIMTSDFESIEVSSLGIPLWRATWPIPNSLLGQILSNA